MHEHRGRTARFPSRWCVVVQDDLVPIGQQHLMLFGPIRDHRKGQIGGDHRLQVRSAKKGMGAKRRKIKHGRLLPSFARIDWKERPTAVILKTGGFSVTNRWRSR